MAKNDFQYAGWNSYTLQCGTITTLISSGDCILQLNVACGSASVTVNSPRGSTLKCDTWLWDDIPLKSPKRQPYIGILHLVSISTHHRSRHVILYQSAKFYPNRPCTLGRKNDVMLIFKMADLSHLGL